MNLSEIIAPAANSMVRQLDDTIKVVLDSCWPPGWTLEDVKRRCSLVRRSSSEVQTFCVDGVPVLELHPVEFEQFPTETGWTMRLTQKYRDLRPSLRR